MEEAIFEYIEGHTDLLREEYCDFVKRYLTKVVNEEVDIDDIKIETFYEFAERYAIEELNYYDEDEAYDRWKEMQDESK